MDRSMAAWGVAALMCAAGWGCGSKQEAAPAAEAPETVEVEETVADAPLAPPPVLEPEGVNEPVAREDIEVDVETRPVEGDFNRDGLPDLAVVTRTVDGEKEVEIYMQEPAQAEEPAASEVSPTGRVEGDGNEPAGRQADAVGGGIRSGARQGRPRYVRAGVIRGDASGRIIGIATAKRATYSDLIVIFAYPDQQNEMIHYRHDGKSFMVVDRFQRE